MSRSCHEIEVKLILKVANCCNYPKLTNIWKVTKKKKKRKKQHDEKFKVSQIIVHLFLD